GAVAARSEARPSRCAGSIPISRAASTQREIDALPDPVTIDLSGVEKVDTVGAGVIYRAVRDGDAKVVGAKEDVAALLERMPEYDGPCAIRPEEVPGHLRV